MFCPKCGSQNPDTSKFCRKCGKSLPDKAQVQQAVSQSYTIAQESNFVGQVFDGKYRIEARLGSGGMGDVYRAARILIGDTVAIKLLHAHLASNPQVAERFRREAVAATKLRHRNVVALYDVGISAAYNVPYLLMELAEGSPLRQILHQQPVLPLDFAVTVTAQVCSALEEAHRLGIVHRDIKPENIIANQTANGWHVKVLDFGIAKLYDGANRGLPQDAAAQYMSPEQLMGEPPDARSDIYGVGVVLYEMLCGTLPFKSAAASAAAAPAPPRSVNPNIAPQVEEVILRALSKQRDARQQSAQELSKELIEAATILFKSGNFSGSSADAPTPTENEPTEEKDSEPEDESPVFSPEAETVAFTNEPEVEETKTVVEEVFEDETDDEETISIESRNNLDSGAENASEKEDLSLVFEDTELLLDELLTDKKAESKETFQPAETRAPFEEKETPDADTAALPKETSEEAQPLFWTIPVTNTSSQPRPKNKKPLIIAIFALIFVGALTGLGWWLLSGEKKPAPVSPDVVASNETQTEPNKAPAEMAYIPGGEFMIGTDDSIDSDKMDTPAHRVSVKPFFMDLNEVTNEDYKKYVDAARHKAPPTWKNGTFPEGKAKFPVTGVDWDDADAYAKWAGKRLPTEEEWEFAARGTDKRIFPWGNEWKNEFANADKQRQETQEVGKSAGKSPFGLLDMSGNAWEWTSSAAKAYPGGKEFDDTMIEPKIIRGGFFGSAKERATTTLRRAYGSRGEKSGYDNTGFRCAKDISGN